ncbi:CBO0543 family protein [Sporomusa sp.]|uniref:CBO0543 family protein n=1 Tax=Sporomusa sp. TaxID=2078658 RepID=UPI002B7A08E5|nr:CBO0543 family protein [Sporomusa sp.]HWR42216.1 CBO0543 family protein [Sporomusa sp.]
MPTIESINEIQNMLWPQLYTHWVNVEIFSFPWWFSVLFLAVSYIIWWKLLDKSRLIELLLFGSLLAVMSAVIDTIADNLMLWQYLVKIFPFTPAFFPFHLTLAPITLMIVYQYTNNWSRYLLGTVFAAAIYSFIIAPLFVAIGEVQLLKWNHGYTFITYIVRALMARWVLILCKHIQGSYQGQPKSMQLFTPFCQPALKPLPNTKDDKEGGSEK